MNTLTLPVEDNVENRLKETFYVVESTSFEQFCHWLQWSKESNAAIDKLEWEQLNPGWVVKIGELDNRPVNISVSWCKIEGKLVMFWYQCSQVTDEVLAKRWIYKHFKGGPRMTTDAYNFIHCVDAIRKANKQ